MVACPSAPRLPLEALRAPTTSIIEIEGGDEEEVLHMFSRRPTRITLVAIAAVCCALGALVSSSALSLAATPTATPTPFANAAATRDNLLTIAKATPFTADSSTTGFGVFPAWSTAYPGLSIDGYGVLANGSNVSTYAGVLYPKSESSANPIVIAFALKDATGVCAAGAISGSSSFTAYEALALPAAAACSGQAALDALRLKLPLATVTATIPATASATSPAASATPKAIAPLPPATGTGPGTDSAPVLSLVAAGIVFLLGSSMAFGLRRRE